MFCTLCLLFTSFDSQSKISIEYSLVEVFNRIFASFCEEWPSRALWKNWLIVSPVNPQDFPWSLEWDLIIWKFLTLDITITKSDKGGEMVVMRESQLHQLCLEHLNDHMTDISVIKMIISVAVWRIYPSWVNDKLWAWEGLGHFGMFWARFSGDDFRSKLKSYVHFEEFFVSRAFAKFGAKRSSPEAFGFDDVLELFLKTALRHRWGIFLRTPTTFFENFFSFFFKAEPVLLAWQLRWSPGWAKLLVVVRKLEWKRDFRALARSSAEGPSIVVAFSTSRLRWSMVQKRQKPDEVSRLWLPFIVYKNQRGNQRGNHRVLRSLFPRPDVSTVLLFAVFLLVAVQSRWSGCRSGTAKKSSHPWHFRCWSRSRNDLECTNLVHSEALYRFSSTIIVVGSEWEKHFDGDFSQDLTFKRWPTKAKLCLA